MQSKVSSIQLSFYSDDTEIQNLNNSNSMRFCESLPKLEVLTEVSKFANQSDNVVDYNLPIHSSCKYYTIL